jgi:hypothetical protein
MQAGFVKPGVRPWASTFGGSLAAQIIMAGNKRGAGHDMNIKSEETRSWLAWKSPGWPAQGQPWR